MAFHTTPKKMYYIRSIFSSSRGISQGVKKKKYYVRTVFPSSRFISHGVKRKEEEKSIVLEQYSPAAVASHTVSKKELLFWTLKKEERGETNEEGNDDRG